MVMVMRIKCIYTMSYGLFRYYVRRNLDGYIENSTAVNNTASENYMFHRFIVDDLCHWVRDYKVDGFR